MRRCEIEDQEERDMRSVVHYDSDSFNIFQEMKVNNGISLKL